MHQPYSPHSQISLDAASGGGREPDPLRILVACSQELWIRSLESVLEARGHVVVGAATGAAALELARATPPDLLVIHSTLSDMPGMTLCRQLHEQRLTDATRPVVIIGSGPCTRGERLAAIRAGAWDCYGSPIDVELLLLKLDVYARARRALQRTRR